MEKEINKISSYTPSLLWQALWLQALGIAQVTSENIRDAEANVAPAAGNFPSSINVLGTIRVSLYFLLLNAQYFLHDSISQSM